MSGQGDGGAGRFAPSPTGPLHLGSLLAATASFLDARGHGLPWRLRFDDLDRPRNVPGAERAILTAMERHGLHWDGPVQHQSEHVDTYRAALEALSRQGEVFYCRCSRRSLVGSAYPGTCRRRVLPRADSAMRVRIDDHPVCFVDLVQGPQRQNLAETCGDFVIHRRDGIIAYQLATAVDDGAPGITRVIRGRDLLDTTPRQLFLMQRLGLNAPDYGHIPLLRNRAGQKLSKQHHAAPVDTGAAAANLRLVLGVLGLGPAPDTRHCADLLAWAVDGFALESVPSRDTVAPSSHDEP